MELFTAASFEPGPAVAIAVTTGFYTWSVRRLRRHGEPWAARRTAAFLVAEALLVVTFFSGLPSMAANSFSAYAAQYILSGLLAPVLLTSALPLTALVKALPEAWRARVLGALEHPAGRLLTSPPVLWLLFASWLLVLFLSGLAADAVRSRAVDQAVFAASAVVGWLFCWAPADIDVRPRRMGSWPRTLYLLLAVPVFTIVGLELQTEAAPIWPGVSPSDLTTGATVLWLVGEVLLLGGILGVWLQWLRDDERRARARDLENTAAAERQLALWRATREAAARAATPRR
jgi:putative membrane protein